MTSLLKKPPYSPRQQEKNWINITFAAHDQICGCDDPWLHLLILLNKEGNAPKPAVDIQNLKWLLIGKPDIAENTTDDHGDETGFYEGELEKLFEETDSKESSGNAATR